MNLTPRIILKGLAIALCFWVLMVGLTLLATGVAHAQPASTHHTRCHWHLKVTGGQTPGSTITLTVTNPCYPGPQTVTHKLHFHRRSPRRYWWDAYDNCTVHAAPSRTGTPGYTYTTCKVIPAHYAPTPQPPNFYKM